MSITFTTILNPDWKNKLDLELSSHLESLTGNPYISPIHNIYAHRGNEFVGGAACQKNGDIVWVGSFWVSDKFRRQGIGAKLMGQVIEYAQQHKAKTLQLNTYFQEARKFYEHCQFTEVSSLPNWRHGLTCYFLERNI